MSTLRGSTTAQANSVRIKYTDAGNRIDFDYDGTQAACASIITALRAQGFEVEYSYDKSPLARVTATYPDREAPGRTGNITDTDNSSGLITAPAHELLDGDAITVADIVGLTAGVTYFVDVISADTFKTYTNFNLATQIKPTNNDDTGTFAKQESPQPRWELFSEARDVPICDARYIDKLAGSQLSDAQRAVLKKVIDGVNYTQAEADLFATPAEHLALFYAVYKTGLRSITYEVPVITVARTITRGYDYAYTMTNVGKILSTSQMTSLESMESGLLDGLTEFGAISNTIVGWRKAFPRREALGGGRFALSQKFEYDWWNSAVFVAAT